MKDNIAIKIDHVSKSFKLPHEKHGSIKNALFNIFRGGKRSYEKQEVLKDINFEIKKGEFFGIVGRNGSGKSTLLKLIAGVYSPDKGVINVNGKLTPFIELGVGFNPELTGRENIFLNGALLGFSRKEMEAMYDEIVEFAELDKFMDQKLKNYSSGMQVRLAFSIAIRADTDILVLDEVLAVGDEAFQRKCYQYFAELKKQKKTVVLVTHDMGSVQQFCTSALMIEKGCIVKKGNPAKVAQKYRELFVSDLEQIQHKNSAQKAKTYGNKSILITGNIHADIDNVNIGISLVPQVDMEDIIISIFLDRDNGEQVYRASSDEKLGYSFDLRKDDKKYIKLKLQNIFPNGIFSLRVSIKSRDRSVEYLTVGDIAKFEIDRRNYSKSEWDIHWSPSEEYIIE